MPRDFAIVSYTLRSRKLRSPVRALLISDLHLREHGPANCELLSACRQQRPELILVCGDIVTQKVDPSLYGPALRLVRELCGLAPVYFVNGNHETGLRRYNRPGWRAVRRALAGAGVHLVNNRSVLLSLNENVLAVSGYEAPLSCFRKLHRPSLPAGALQEALGDAAGAEGEEVFRLLLAHNPQFLPAYLEWGADLVLCGHFHGGLMRLYGNQVLVSPYGFPFPGYGYGHFSLDGRHAIVSAGLGDHALPLRIHNPMELVVIELLPDPGAPPAPPASGRIRRQGGGRRIE